MTDIEREIPAKAPDKAHKKKHEPSKMARTRISCFLRRDVFGAGELDWARAPRRDPPP